MVIEAGEFVELFASDHEGRQVGSVDGEEDDGEHGPNIGHEAGGEAARRVNVYRRLEEHGPYQPVGTKQRESAVCSRGYLGSIKNLCM